MQKYIWLHDLNIKLTDWLRHYSSLNWKPNCTPVSLKSEILAAASSKLWRLLRTNTWVLLIVILTLFYIPTNFRVAHMQTTYSRSLYFFCEQNTQKHVLEMQDTQRSAFALFLRTAARVRDASHFFFIMRSHVNECRHATRLDQSSVPRVMSPSWRCAGTARCTPYSLFPHV